jgi:hypothetical protein
MWRENTREVNFILSETDLNAEVSMFWDVIMDLLNFDEIGVLDDITFKKIGPLSIQASDGLIYNSMPVPAQSVPSASDE